MVTRGDFPNDQRYPGRRNAGRLKASLEFKQKIDAVAASISPEEKAKADEIVERTSGFDFEDITPAMAAYILIVANNFNRAMTFSKVYGYVEAMKRGEWKLNHQGIAFYDDGRVADGQHRLGAAALAGFTLSVIVYSGFAKDAIDTIDRATKRTAGEALEMLGIDKGKVKATTAKAALELISEIDGSPVRLTDPQVEAEVIAYDATYSELLGLAERSTKNVSSPSMSIADAFLIGAVLEKGGWMINRIAGHLAAIQQGIATTEGSPTFLLAKRLAKAQQAEHNKDKLTKRERVALTLKAVLFAEEGKVVTKLDWNATKEVFPSYRAPVEHAAAAE